MSETLADGLTRGPDGRVRCGWGGEAIPGFAHYHDTEWGFPVDDDHKLFEKICLEGFQSGLSWLTILRKRPSFRRAFADFQISKVASFGPTTAYAFIQAMGLVNDHLHGCWVRGACEQARTGFVRPN
ncbi:MAG: DNA-3-methyladenine glycosylase I [Actinomycetia bacterium]|nr:DNA-3-methyladenine glycosylase I [Actinomycetes bacterium]